MGQYKVVITIEAKMEAEDQDAIEGGRIIEDALYKVVESEFGTLPSRKYTLDIKRIADGKAMYHGSTIWER